ncbi:hypothetical protein GWK47_023715 [Chionoecetes opilio]|uniref:Uncharacterized protein n=1 Tax=Chionoecetes opilio TaxID=41210 RepID=A0A8J4XQ83_CHIOP|nr:hypothetical protein GWK47_023715 [Chionoecetes opilio]
MLLLMAREFPTSPPEDNTFSPIVTGGEYRPGFIRTTARINDRGTNSTPVRPGTAPKPTTLSPLSEHRNGCAKMKRSDEVVVEDRIGNENITEENNVVLDVAPDDLEVIHDPSTLPSTSSNTRNTTQASKPSRRVLWTKNSSAIKKVLHRLVFHMIDINYQSGLVDVPKDYETKRIPPEKKHALLSFRMSLSESLIRAGKCVPKRGFTSSSPRMADRPTKRCQKMGQVRPQKDVRLDKVGSGRGGKKQRQRAAQPGNPAAGPRGAVEDATRSPSSSPRAPQIPSRSGSVDSHASLASTVAKSKKKDKKDNKLSDDEEELMVAFLEENEMRGTRRPRYYRRPDMKNAAWQEQAETSRRKSLICKGGSRA